MYKVVIDTSLFSAERLIDAGRRERLLFAAGEIFREIIIDEAERGIFANGQGFKYSKSRKRTRDKQGLQTRFVDMIDTGATVIQGIQLRVNNDDIELFIAAESDAGRREKWNRKRYNFFGANKRRIQLLNEKLQPAAKKIFA